MKIAVPAATGHIGSQVVKQLLAHGADVTVLVRHPDKLAAEVRAKVTLQEGSVHDLGFVLRATKGADALFWLTPPNLDAPDLRAYMVGLGQIAAQALRENRIGRVVNISSRGAHDAHSGPVSWIGEVERLLESAAPNTMNLRPAYFMENLMNAIPQLKQGMLYDAVPGSLPIAMVATRDIGDVAAKWLFDGSWKGHLVRGVLGPADVTMEQTAAILSEILGKPIKHTQIGTSQLRDAFLGMRASASVADAYAEMFEGLARNKFEAPEPRDAETTTPTTLAQFARETLKPAFEA